MKTRKFVGELPLKCSNGFQLRIKDMTGKTKKGIIKFLDVKLKNTRLSMITVLNWYFSGRLDSKTCKEVKRK